MLAVPHAERARKPVLQPLELLIGKSPSLIGQMILRAQRMQRDLHAVRAEFLAELPERVVVDRAHAVEHVLPHGAVQPPRIAAGILHAQPRASDFDHCLANRRIVIGKPALHRLNGHVDRPPVCARFDRRLRKVLHGLLRDSKLGLQYALDRRGMPGGALVRRFLIAAVILPGKCLVAFGHSLKHLFHILNRQPRRPCDLPLNAPRVGVQAL